MFCFNKFVWRQKFRARNFDVFRSTINWNCRFKLEDKVPRSFCFLVCNVAQLLTLHPFFESEFKISSPIFWSVKIGYFEAYWSVLFIKPLVLPKSIGNFSGNCYMVLVHKLRSKNISTNLVGYSWAQSKRWIFKVRQSKGVALS